MSRTRRRDLVELDANDKPVNVFKEDYWEIWRWSWSYSDGSQPLHASGWGTSYRMCKEDILLNCRMKRIK